MSHTGLQQESTSKMQEVPPPLITSTQQKENLPWNSDRNEKHSTILKYGETIESFFHWHKHSDDVEYQNLCRIALDTAGGATLEQQAAAWRRILEVRGRDTEAEDLLRWHRRATSYFTCRLQEKADKPLSHLFRTDWLQIWLSYAMLQAPSNINSARKTLRHIQNQSGAALPAAFYVTWAQLEATEEDHYATSKQILREGLRRKAEPILDLDKALQQLPPAKRFKEDRTNESTAPSQDSNMSLDTDGGSLTNSPVASIASPVEAKDSLQFQLHGPILRSTPTHDYKPSQFHIPILGHRSTTISGRDISMIHRDQSNIQPPPIDAPVVPATLAAEEDRSVKNTEVKRQDNIPPSNMMPTPPLVVRNKLATPSHETIIPPPVPTKDFKDVVSATSKGIQATSSVRLPISSKIRGTVIPPLHPPTNPNVRYRPQVTSKRPPLKTFGLGKAERVDPSQSILELDSDEEKTTEEQRRIDTTPSQPRKISKMDLEYMWNWDPEKKRGPEPAESQGTPSLSSSSCSNASLSNGEGKPGNSSEAGTETAIRSSNAAATESMNLPPTSLDRAIQPVVDGPSSCNGRSKINADFLPLIYESNVIRVNNEPYVKLGVIGKGGSCKVYRALSKDGTVWAIKRVKLQDLDRKAMDGYANEIALLNRLRGNPSIIQLQDSEVDPSRQVILLVMEAGEADLNHVLQRQSLLQGGSSKSLNMNFIRLTWQQMLKAVHSIHEQRIIHGDLKPANFLFVRGTLKLIDFGIAKAIQNDSTTHIYRESQIGTLNYMSPEAICDSGTSELGQRMKCGRPSDIWSLGCILYQMVYGKTPFADLHMIPKLQAIVNPNHEIAYPPTVDEAAIDAIQQCLRRKPQDRAPIVGTNGLLNEHIFLNSRHRGDG